MPDFQTTLAGSLPKPFWLAETDKLWPAWKSSGAELAKAKRDATLLWLKEQEDAGLDIVTDGEQSRQHFVHGFLEFVDGIDFSRKVKMGIRNNRYDAMVPVVTGPLKLRGRVHQPEARFARRHTGRALKITKAVVGGGPLFPAVRQFYADRGISCLQGYGTADLGSVAYESAAREGMIVDEGVIVEIVRPGTGDPVPEGEVGEVLVTVLNTEYPLTRFATGDLSAVLPGTSPCGRTNMRIRGWLGRADQTTKVKGMFVHPEQVAEVAKRHAGVGRVRLVVGRSGEQDTMTLRVEAPDETGLKAKLAETLQAVTKLKGDVEIVAPGSLPNDGKVIADERAYT